MTRVTLARRRAVVPVAARRDRAAALIGTGATVLATSVLIDSAMEHYRAQFNNPAMLTPLVTAGLSAVVNTMPLVAATDPKGRGRISGHIATAVSGAVGLALHVHSILSRPGQLSFTNLFYAAPVGAPAALVLASGLGAAADSLRAGGDRLGPFSLTSGRLLAGFSAAGIMGTVGEAWLLHFRGAFQNPAMFLPVVLPPVAALALARDAVRGEASGTTRTLLVATAVLGVVGVGFHAYGVSRMMGGWRNWRQNVADGPPLPAPPAFTGLATAALGALLLMDQRL